MPFLGAGVDQHVNPAVTPTWIFTPTPNAPATVRLDNEGTNTVYVGQANVSPFNGFPLPPNSKPFQMQGVTTTLYACSGVIAGTGTSTLNGAVAAGSTVLTLVTAASFVVGSTAIIGNSGKGQEVATVTGTTATALTLSTATLYDHATGVTVSTATVVPTQLRVTAGVV